MLLSRSYLRILKELSRNARTKRKDIAKRLRISPQMISYSISRLEQQKIIKNYTANIDPARFGLINVYLFLAYTNFEKDIHKKIVDALMKEEYITYVEELSHGADLLIEFTVSNLSLFNKRNIALLEEIGDYVETISVNPVIVKHQFSREYLAPTSRKRIEKIFSGDREPFPLTSNSKSILHELWLNPKKTVFSIAESTGLDVRTVLKVLKRLSEEKVIRAFSIDVDYKKLYVNSAILLISIKNLTDYDVKKLIAISKTIPEIVSVTKVIGIYGLLIKIESINGYEHIIDRIRKEVNFHKYFLYDSRDVLKNTYIPEIVLK